MIGSTEERSVHARSMSDFPDSVLAGDYAAVRELMETRAGASTADGYAHSVSGNGGGMSATIRGRSSVSSVTTPISATSPYRMHKMERTGSLTSASSIERFNNMNLVTDEGSTIGTRLQRSTSRRSRNNNDDGSDHSSSAGRGSLLAASRQSNYASIESNDVDGVCTRSQKLLIRAQQEFCMARQASNLLNSQQDTNLPAGFAVSPRLGPVVPSIHDATQQYLNPHSANGRSAGGPSVESRLDEVVESSVRLDRILRQVSADLRKGRTTEASQAVLELWRDSEQVVRGLTDVLLGLSAGVPRSRSPVIAPTNDSPRGTPTRAYRTSASASTSAGMTGRISANGRSIPTPLQLPTPVADHESH
ncbi:hypothetical protein BDF22DRAFT_324279 [Syncephalis plumigaleata]|nr:hypothetical protein BDF22DRAFT_324279 [Syncephalis plumigaleata]